jgi:hypothetical protein
VVSTQSTTRYPQWVFFFFFFWGNQRKSGKDRGEDDRGKNDREDVTENKIVICTQGQGTEPGLGPE